ncbi:radical SAM protein [Anaerorhabdus sp.]|uniref:radical SAM/SPASM domain-containing protein n=1 Tax=Anaerorhabdus sp. TaxID=1872524 RepID=UPI002B221935|nr:radical SAM protein [Anaerorhabdus sp.]MEA4875291.1 radical SAM protein [Anaerorhabdus sp.]
MFTKYFEKLKIKEANYLYNLKTGHLLFLDSDSDEKVSKIINDENIKLCFKDKFILKRYGFLVSKDTPIYSKNNKAVITIGVTKKCNCNCEYCFERERRDETSAYNTKYNFHYLLLKYILFISRKIDSLEIIWYGGEPSISIDEVVFISNEVSEICKKNNKCFEKSMITNGLLLNSVNISKIKTTKISRFQITLDGPEKYHNSIKSSATILNFYRTVIENIKLLVKHNYKVTININVDKNNKGMIKELLDDLVINELIHNKFVNIRFSRIVGTPYEIEKIEFEEICLNYDNYLIEIGYKNFELRSPSFEGYCQLDYNNFSITVDNQGNLYTCIEEVFDETKSKENLEHLDWGKFIEDKMNYNSSSNVNLIGKCTACKYLPFCRGMCPLMRNQENECIELVQKQIYREVSRYIGARYEKDII